MSRCWKTALTALGLATLAACSGQKSKPAAGRLTLAVIPKGTTHEFWKSVHAGALKASRELDEFLAAEWFRELGNQLHRRLRSERQAIP